MTPFSYSTQVVLRPDSDPGAVAAAIEAEVARGGSVVVTVRTEGPVPDAVVEAAVGASSSSQVLLYVRGYSGDPDPRVLAPFSRVEHVNVNVRSSVDVGFLADFTALRSLTVQTSTARKLDLTFLAGMQELTWLSIRGAVRATDALRECRTLEFLNCSSSPAVLSALTGHPHLRYLDVSFGSCRDLSALPTIPTLRGVAMHRVTGLDGDDLRPIGECASLRALSLGALRHVTHLDAVTGHRELRALLMEAVPNLGSLHGLAGCENLEQLGLYDSRPVDRSLAPLRGLTRLAHLVLGDPYPAAEIEALTAWYAGALSYRGDGPSDFKPRWRTSIDHLDPPADR